MVDNVTFSRFDMAEDLDIVTVEDVYRKYASFANLQGFEFEDTLNTFTVTHWNDVPIPLSNMTFGGIIAKSDHVNDERWIWYDTDMPHSYTIEFTAHRPIWGYAFRGDGPDENDYYYIRYVHDTSDYIELYRVTDATAHLLDQKELHGTEASNWNKVQIAVRDAPSTADDDSRLLFVNVWLNGNMVFACSDITTNILPLRMALLCSPGATGTLYSDLRIPNLGEIITWSSLDPGQNPIDAISQAIEDRYIKMWSRWNGNLKAWKPKARTTTLTIDTSKELSLSPVFDLKQVFSHIRVLGAFQWVQVYDASLIRLVGRRFKEVQNTNLWNTDDCYRIGLDLLMRMKEQANQVQFRSYGLPFVEIEDRLSLPDHINDGQHIDYIIDSLSYSYEANSLVVDVQARRYYYGEP